MLKDKDAEGAKDKEAKLLKPGHKANSKEAKTGEKHQVQEKRASHIPGAEKEKRASHIPGAEKEKRASHIPGAK